MNEWIAIFGHSTAKTHQYPHPHALFFLQSQTRVEAFVGHKGHELLPITYRTPTNCEVCPKSLGNILQPPPAYECKRCRIKIHKEHLDRKVRFGLHWSHETLVFICWLVRSFADWFINSLVCSFIYWLVVLSLVDLFVVHSLIRSVSRYGGRQGVETS